MTVSITVSQHRHHKSAGLHVSRVVCYSSIQIVKEVMKTSFSRIQAWFPGPHFPGRSFSRCPFVHKAAFLFTGSSASYVVKSIWMNRAGCLGSWYNISTLLTDDLTCSVKSTCTHPQYEEAFAVWALVACLNVSDLRRTQPRIKWAQRLLSETKYTFYLPGIS